MIASPPLTDFQQRMQQIDGLVARIEQSADPAARAAAQDVVRLLLDLHASGLAKLLDRIAGEDEARARAIFTDLARDELVSSLLLLHNLHPCDLETRVRQALDDAASSLRARGVEVELLEASEDVVRLRLKGGCGCASTTATLRQAIEDLVAAAAPEAGAVAFDDPPASEALVQLGVPHKAIAR